MNNIIAICTIVFTALLGFLVIRKFKIYDDDVSVQVCLGFAVGMGIVTLQMIVYSLLGFEWTRAGLILPNILFLLILGTVEVRRERLRNRFLKIQKKIQRNVKNVSLIKIFPKILLMSVRQNSLQILLSSCIILLICFVFFEAMVRPLTSWDSWASWQMKSKMYFYDGKVTIEGFHYLSSEYPLAVSLYSTFLYKIVNSVHETSASLVSAFYYLFIGIMCFSSIKTKTNLKYATVFTFLVLSSQNLIRHGGRYEGGNADIVMAFFILVIAIVFMKTMYGKKRGSYALLFILLGIVANIKNEGIIFAGITFLFVFMLAFKRKQYIPFYQSLWMIIPIVGWSTFKHFYSLPAGILSGFQGIDPVLLFGIFRVEVLQYLNVQNWNLGWLFVGTSLSILVLSRKVPVVLVLLVMQAISYYGVFLFSSADPVEHARGISDRLFLHLFPAFVVYTAIYMYPLIKKNRLMSKFKLV